MLNMSDTTASAVKTAVVAGGTGITYLHNFPAPTAQAFVGYCTVAYAVCLLVKMMPAVVDVLYSTYRIVRYRDMQAWRDLRNRSEKGE